MYKRQPQEAPALFFGDRLAAKTTFLSVEQLAAITPPGPVGPVNVTVINPDGAMAKLISGFIYEDKPGPVITSINPTHGPVSYTHLDVYKRQDRNPPDRGRIR